MVEAAGGEHVAFHIISISYISTAHIGYRIVAIKNMGFHFTDLKSQNTIRDIMCKLSLFTSLLCDNLHTKNLFLLTCPACSGILIDHEKRYIPKAAGLEIESQAETASVARCASNRIFNEFDGAFVENFAAQQLMAHFEQPLHYWRSKGGKAELDFLCEFSGRIYPLEVKAGINPRSKSLRSYDSQFSPSVLARATLLNLKTAIPSTSLKAE